MADIWLLNSDYVESEPLDRVGRVAVRPCPRHWCACYRQCLKADVQELVPSIYNGMRHAKEEMERDEMKTRWKEK